MASQSAYVVIYNATSPLFTYSPYAYGATSGGWTSSWSGGIYTTSDGKSTAGSGRASHVTAYSGSKLELSFFDRDGGPRRIVDTKATGRLLRFDHATGTGITLYGAPGAFSSYQVTIDGTTQSGSASSGTLASFQGLSDTNHDVTLQLGTNVAGDPSTNPFVFYEADITVGTGLAGGTISTTRVDDNDGSISCSGSGWQRKNSPYLTSDPGIHQASQTGDAATLSFTGCAIALYGNTNSNHGLYSMYVDDPGSSRTFNGASAEFVGQNLFYQKGGLDCNQFHTVVFTNGGNTFFDLDYFVVTSISGAQPLGSITAVATPTQTLGSAGLPTDGPVTSTSHTSKTPIIAGVVAGVVALALLGALIIWCWKRRERQHQRELEMARENVLEDQNHLHGPVPPAIPTFQQPVIQTGRPQSESNRDSYISTTFKSTTDSIGLSPSPGITAPSSSVPSSEKRTVYTPEQAGFSSAGPSSGSSLQPWSPFVNTVAPASPPIPGVSTQPLVPGLRAMSPYPQGAQAELAQRELNAASPPPIYRP